MERGGRFLSPLPPFSFSSIHVVDVRRKAGLMDRMNINDRWVMNKELRKKTSDDNNTYPRRDDWQVYWRKKQTVGMRIFLNYESHLSRLLLKQKKNVSFFLSVADTLMDGEKLEFQQIFNQIKRQINLPGQSHVHLIISQLSVMVILTIFLFYLSLFLSSSTYSNNKSKCSMHIFDLLTYRKIDFLSRYWSSTTY